MDIYQGLVLTIYFIPTHKSYLDFCRSGYVWDFSLMWFSVKKNKEKDTTTVNLSYLATILWHHLF